MRISGERFSKMSMDNATSINVNEQGANNIYKINESLK